MVEKCRVGMGSGWSLNQLGPYLIYFINNIRPTEFIRPLSFFVLSVIIIIQAAQYKKTSTLRDHTAGIVA